MIITIGDEEYEARWEPPLPDGAVVAMWAEQRLGGHSPLRHYLECTEAELPETLALIFPEIGYLVVWKGIERAGPGRYLCREKIWMRERSCPAS